jgi:hypothetical protein
MRYSVSTHWLIFSLLSLFYKESEWPISRTDEGKLISTEVCFMRINTPVHAVEEMKK